MLQDNGIIRMSQLNIELGRAPGALISLNQAEDGAYGAINQSRLKRPAASNPAAISEWYSYCHTCGAVWKPVSPFCVTTRSCAAGWTPTADGLSCSSSVSMAATPPTANGGTPGTVARIQDIQWNNGGALLFAPGYSLAGDGTYTSLLVPHLWVNGNAPYDFATRNLIDSRMNAAGIWGATAIPNNEWVGFSRKITSTVAKTVYVGMSADNAFKFTLNGVLMVSTDTTAGGPNFSHWNIYPVPLVVGDNYIEMYARNYGGPAGFAAEVYDNTAAQLSAATVESDLTILFSTRTMAGQPFDLGQTYGWSCPATGGWFLVNTAGVYTCSKGTTVAATLTNTGVKGYATRQRMMGEVPDGYTEPNTNGVGIGPYFPPVTDTISCPI